MTNKLVQEDRISYSESVKINIGDYESRDIYISYSLAIKDGKDFDATLKKAKIKVKKALLKEERKVRLGSKEDVEFNTMDRV